MLRGAFLVYGQLWADLRLELARYGIGTLQTIKQGRRIDLNHVKRDILTALQGYIIAFEPLHASNTARFAPRSTRNPPELYAPRKPAHIRPAPAIWHAPRAGPIGHAGRRNPPGGWDQPRNRLENGPGTSWETRIPASKNPPENPKAPGMLARGLLVVPESRKSESRKSLSSRLIARKSESRSPKVGKSLSSRCRSRLARRSPRPRPRSALPACRLAGGTSPRPPPGFAGG